MKQLNDDLKARITIFALIVGGTLCAAVAIVAENSQASLERARTAAKYDLPY